MQNRGRKTTAGLKAKQEVKRGKRRVGETVSTLTTSVDLETPNKCKVFSFFVEVGVYYPVEWTEQGGKERQPM